MTKIAITGMACLFPGAPDVDTYWANICGKVDSTSEPPPEAWDPDVYWDPEFKDTDKTYVRRGGYLGDLATFEPISFGIPPVAVGGEPDQWLALRVATAAMADAGATDLPSAIRERTTIILGKGTYVNGGNATAIQRSMVVGQTIELLRQLHPEHSEEYLSMLRREFESQLPVLGPETVSGLIPNIIVGRIANRLDLMGPAYTVDAACASSLVAIEHAISELAAGNCDLALAGGSQVWMPVATLNLFCKLGALSRRERLAPFDVNADGTLLGEGIGMIVLRRLEDAVAAGDRVYAVIRGVGLSSDGRGMGVMAPRLEGEELALRRAYERAGVEPSTVGLIEAHGTGTPVGDVTEVQALTRVFGQRGSALLPRTALGSVKSMISHTIPAAGVAGVIKTALALHHRVLPPTLNVEQPNPKLELERTPFYLNTETRPWIHGGSEPRRAGVNAFGFGGINAHAVLEEYDGGDASVMSHAAPWDTEVCLLEADSAPALADRAGQLLAALIDGRSLTLPQLAASLASELSSIPSPSTRRLGIVAGTLDDLRRKLETAIGKLGDPDCKRIRSAGGVYYESNPLGHAGKIALVFPGEGSQYPNMLSDLTQCFPEARAWFDRLDRMYVEHRRGFVLSDCVFPRPAYSEDEERTIEARLNRLDIAVESVLTANLALHAVLSRIVPRVDAVVGHSTGEYSAAMAAGALDLQVDVDLATFCHGLADANIEAYSRQDVPKAVLMSVGTSAAEVAEIVAEAGGELYVGMDNCPHQVVLVGEAESIARARAIAVTRSLVCETLPYDRAVHTPLFASMAEDTRSILALVPVRAPSVPLWSCTSAAPHADEPAEIRDLLVKHWTSTVRFRETIEALYDDGCRVFIESGARGNLTAFIEDILRGRPICAVPADVRRRSGIEQLNHLVATLAAQGVALNPGYLFEQRGIAHVDWRTPIGPAEGRKGPKITLSTAWPTLRLAPETVDSLSARVPVPDPEGDRAPAASNGHASFAGNVRRQAAPGPARPEAAISPTAPEMGVQAPMAGSPEGAAPASDPGPLDPPAVAAAGTEVGDWAMVMEGHLSLMEQFLQTGSEVMQTYLTPQPPAEPRRMPLLGSIVSHAPGQALVAERVIDLDTDVYLRDHTIGRGVSRVDPSLTALALMPMTMSLEILAEAASELMPGLVVTGIRDIRAHRWLVVGESPAMVEVTATALGSQGGTSVEVLVLLGELDDKAELLPVLEGIVRLDSAYPAARAAAPHALPSDVRQCRFTPDRLYEDAMFHGPFWRGVRSVDWVAGSAAAATLEVLPRTGMLQGQDEPAFVLDPVLLDAAGQLIGFWAADHLESGNVVFPFKLEALEVMAAPPAVGRQLECRASIVRDGQQLVRSDIEVFGADGTCIVRLAGWEDKRFDVPPAFRSLSAPGLLPILSTDWPGPARATAADRVACRRMGVELGADAGLWRQVWASRVLGRREREVFAALTVPPRRQLEWLAARTAAKEAVAALLRDLDGTDLRPADIEILADAGGRPVVVGVEVAGLVPLVSLTHSGGQAAALAALVPARLAATGGIGIDLERLTARPLGFAEALLTDPERLLLNGVAEESLEEWHLRCWCAKEAAGKAAGTGLVPGTVDAPKVIGVDLARQYVEIEMVGGRLCVQTQREENVIIATAVADEARIA